VSQTEGQAASGPPTGPLESRPHAVSMWPMWALGLVLLVDSTDQSVMVGVTFFAISWMRLPFAPAFVLEIIGWFVMTMAIPGLRAGLSDAVPANLRGAGFGAFNLVSVVFGGALAPLIVSVLSQSFGDNLRTAFLIISPPVYVGAYILLRARDHLEADAAKIFEAVLTAMQEQQAREQQAGSLPGQGRASHQ